MSKKKNLVLILLTFFLFAREGYSAFSQRRCLLLPIKDSVSGSIGFKVFEQVEIYLREGSWCYYEPNSGILDILANYKRNLDTHLQNKEVLRTIAEKSHAGSLIRIELTNVLKGMDVRVKIIGENGEDVYFKEETRLNTDDPVVVSQTVRNWLDIYEKSIPYDGKIIGVLGDQFTVDIGRGYGAFAQNKVQIVRPIKKKRHPLLNEIVDWETQIIGAGKLFHVSNSQSQGNMTQYENRKKTRVDDWVILRKDNSASIKKSNDRYYDEINENSFGKHGTLGLYATIGTGSNTIINSSTKKIGGLLFGIDLQAEVWGTREWWGAIELGRRFATYSQKEGSLASESNVLSGSKFKFKAGYKYLPLGFFYGPQVDGYLGYATYGYGFDTSLLDNISGVDFSGMLFGVKGTLPIHKLIKIFLTLDFILNPTFEEDVTIFGEADSTSNYHMELGGTYVYSQNMTYELSLGYTTSNANFRTNARSVSLKETEVKIGAVFTF